MAAETRFNIDSENFSLYFEQQIAGISPSAKESMPKDVAHKIYRGGAKSDTKSTSKLSFIAKLWILEKYLKKRHFIIVEDEQNGMGLDDFLQLRESLSAKANTVNKSEELSVSGTFITANKELCDCLALLNQSSASPAYNYLQKAKNGIKLKQKHKVTEWVQSMKGVIKMIAHYEGSKKKWVGLNLITVPEFFVLISLYHGQETIGSSIYNGSFKYAFQSSKTKIQKAFTTLQTRSLIKKVGTTRDAKFIITPAGTEIVNMIATKFMINC